MFLLVINGSVNTSIYPFTLLTTTRNYNILK